jgi:hypothetical protein
LPFLAGNHDARFVIADLSIFFSCSTGDVTAVIPIFREEDRRSGVELSGESHLMIFCLASPCSHVVARTQLWPSNVSSQLLMQRFGQWELPSLSEKQGSRFIVKRLC